MKSEKKLNARCKHTCENCGYRVPKATRLAIQPKCERPIDNIDDACRNFAKWIPTGAAVTTGQGDGSTKDKL